MSDTIYLPFPITFLKTAFADIRGVCSDIIDYAVYRKSLTEDGDPENSFRKAAKFYRISLGNFSNSMRNGKDLYDSTPENIPITSINSDVLFDYYQNFKTDQEIALLCAFLAIKSIIGYKPYAKITNRYLLCRMAGYAKIQDADELPDPILKYSTRKRLNNLKYDLMESWGLKIYSRYTRGWFASFKLDINDLVLEGEKKRKKYKQKHFKELELEAIRQAQQKLNMDF